MDKKKIDINILGQDISVMCSEEEEKILIKSRDRINQEADKIKAQSKNIGHDYFLAMVLLNVAGSDIKNSIRVEELESLEEEIESINSQIEDVLK